MSSDCLLRLFFTQKLHRNNTFGNFVFAEDQCYISSALICLFQLVFKTAATAMADHTKIGQLVAQLFSQFKRSLLDITYSNNIDIRNLIKPLWNDLNGLQQQHQ